MYGKVINTPISVCSIASVYFSIFASSHMPYKYNTLYYIRNKPVANVRGNRTGLRAKIKVLTRNGPVRGKRKLLGWPSFIMKKESTIGYPAVSEVQV
ncbi:Hypothetical predicted protein [Podarcis lilfordi]|uniref:Uncharacterized protein n=1 Tax=Podarcis lilfordi TaxID=74358 RepID=A0AA35PDA4_9SAUR|nr:Hypothetical predicted protein [Podarcis lilfordi]